MQPEAEQYIPRPQGTTFLEYPELGPCGAYTDEIVGNVRQREAYGWRALKHGRFDAAFDLFAPAIAAAAALVELVWALNVIPLPDSFLMVLLLVSVAVHIIFMRPSEVVNFTPGPETPLSAQQPWAPLREYRAAIRRRDVEFRAKLYRPSLLLRALMVVFNVGCLSLISAYRWKVITCRPLSFVALYGALVVASVIYQHQSTLRGIGESLVIPPAPLPLNGTAPSNPLDQPIRGAATTTAAARNTRQPNEIPPWRRTTRPAPRATTERPRVNPATVPPTAFKSMEEEMAAFRRQTAAPAASASAPWQQSALRRPTPAVGSPQDEI